MKTKNPQSQMITDAFPKEAVESIKKLYETIDHLVSMKPMLMRVSKIMADLDKLTSPGISVPRRKPNGKK